MNAKLRYATTGLLACILSAPALAQQPRTHIVKTGPDTVEWGYYDASKKPVAVIDSGDIVQIESPLAGSREMETFGIADLITPKCALSKPECPTATRDLGPTSLWARLREWSRTRDVLEVRILTLEPIDNYGVNLFVQGHGALSDDLPRMRVKNYSLG